MKKIFLFIALILIINGISYLFLYNEIKQEECIIDSDNNLDYCFYNLENNSYTCEKSNIKTYTNRCFDIEISGN